jgi:hypothetical protein
VKCVSALPRSVVSCPISPVGLEGYTRQPRAFIDTTGEGSPSACDRETILQGWYEGERGRGKYQTENVRWGRDDRNGCEEDETDNV